MSTTPRPRPFHQIPSWRREGDWLVGRIDGRVVEVYDLVIPPETIRAVADVWTQILLADLERHPPQIPFTKHVLMSDTGG